jgi:hypothetical protein
MEEGGGFWMWRNGKELLVNVRYVAALDCGSDCGGLAFGQMEKVNQLGKVDALIDLVIWKYGCFG